MYSGVQEGINRTGLELMRRPNEECDAKMAENFREKKKTFWLKVNEFEKGEVRDCST